VQRWLKPGGLRGSNGLRLGRDGRLHVAEAYENRISAIDTGSGIIRTTCPRGGPIVGPDDLDFHPTGDLLVTEPFLARVSMIRPDGRTRVIARDLPGVNGITVAGWRIFADERSPAGRLMELYADGREPREIAGNLPFANALALGPDGKLYFPLTMDGQIWRVDPDGGRVEKCFDGLAAPSAVRFAANGKLLVSESTSGRMMEIEVDTGRRRVAGEVPAGVDNFAVHPNGLIYISHFIDGSIHEITRDRTVRTVVGGGLVGPWGIAARPQGGLYVADGLSLAEIVERPKIGRPIDILGTSSPGMIRDVVTDDQGRVVVATTDGTIARIAPHSRPLVLASGLDGLCALCMDGDRIVASQPALGRIVALPADGGMQVLADGLDTPTGLSAHDRSIHVSESGQGRIVVLRNGNHDIVAGGLGRPEGLVATPTEILVIDSQRRSLVRLDRAGGGVLELARNLPLRGWDDASGPSLIRPFAAIAVQQDGSIFISGNDEGNIVSLVPVR